MVQFWKNSNFLMYLISVITLIKFSALSILACLLMMECVSPEDLLVSPNAIHTGKPFAAVFMVFTALKAFFSILSIIGIKKSQPVLIAMYLGYGAFMVITIFVMVLLLLLLAALWAEALAAAVFDGLYVYYLVKMHDGYESMLRGKCSDNLEHNLLQEEEVPV